MWPPMPDFAPITHETFVADVLAIAATLAADAWKPHWLVGVGRGGLVPGAYLSQATGIQLLSVDVSSKHISFADALLEKLAAETRDGQRLLIVDDINDSGKTIGYLRRAIGEAGGLSDHVRVAVLINNIRSQAHVDYCSRTIDRSSDKRWFVFPWEALAPETKLVEDAADVPERLA